MIPSKRDETQIKYDIINIASGKTLSSVYSHLNTQLPVAGSPDGRYLAIGGKKTTVSIYDIKDKNKPKKIDFPLELRLECSYMKFSKTGEYLALYGDQAVTVLHLKDGEVNKCLECSFEGEVNSVCFSCTDTQIAIAYDMRSHGEVEVWDIKSQKQVAFFSDCAPNCQCYFVGTDAMIITDTCPRDGGTIQLIRLWEIETKKTLQIYSTPGSFDTWLSECEKYLYVWNSKEKNLSTFTVAKSPHDLLSIAGNMASWGSVVALFPSENPENETTPSTLPGLFRENTPELWPDDEGDHCSAVYTNP